MTKLHSRIFVYSLIAITSVGTVWASQNSQDEEKQKTTQQSNNPPQDPSNALDKVGKETNRAMEDIKEGADKLGKNIAHALGKNDKDKEQE